MRKMKMPLPNQPGSLNNHNSGSSTERGSRSFVGRSSFFLSKSSLSSGSLSRLSSSSNIQSNGGGGAAGSGSSRGDPRGSTIYERLKWAHEFDHSSQKDLALGRRIGFYKFKSDLGAGNFSKVKLATHQLTKERVAVKMIDKSKLDSKTQRMVAREIQIMDSLCHPHLIRLYEVVESIGSLHLVMEYAHGGELFARLTGEKGPYRESPEAKVIFAQIASAVDYMHDRFFIHRDLKAENVFFASTASDLNVKVGDFGFATKVEQIDQHLNTFCGSPPYAAPELFQDDHYYGPSVDIWALGVLLYFMVTGQMPFKGSTVAALKKSILDGHFEVPGNISIDCTDLIKSILRRKPAWRLTMEQIKSCDWLKGIPWPGSDKNYRSTPLILNKPELKTEPIAAAAVVEAVVNGVGRDDDQAPETNGGTTVQTLPPPPSSLLIAAKEAKHDLIVRKDLEVLGISKKHLESHIERGVKSPIIGTYRILMHRLVLTGDVNGVVAPSSKARLGDTLGHSQDGHKLSNHSSTLSNSYTSTKSGGGKQVVVHSSELLPKDLKATTSKSKTCNIL